MGCRRDEVNEGKVCNTFLLGDGEKKKDAQP